MFRQLLLVSFFSVVFYLLGMLVIRLHMTQLAYTFEESKEYERSLKEEQRRLKASLAQELSLENLGRLDFLEPEAEKVVFIP